MESLGESAVMKKVFDDFAKNAERVWRNTAAQEGKVLTGDMVMSIRAGATEAARGFVTAHVYYSKLLRILDMKTLNFLRTPPLSALIEYVEKVGVDKFAYVPGYTAGLRPATESEAVERIAWGMKAKLKQEPNVKRGYRGIYNEPLKNDILPTFYRDLRQASGSWGMSQFRLMFNQP